MADRAKRATVRQRDVATQAQCSAATVSRVLNAPESVNAEARSRVEAAVRQLGYMRNGAARALRSRRTQIVGIVIPTIGQPIYAEFVETLQRTLAQEDHSLIVTTSGYDLDRELMQVRLLVERGVDGLVLIGHTHRRETFTLLAAQDLPYVTTYTFKPGLRHPVIGFDNFAAMGRIVEHLYALGHRSFAMLTGSQRRSDRVEERAKGAMAALAAREVALPGERVLEAPLTIEGGRSGLGRLIDTGRRPSAVICTNDVLAQGVLIEAAVRDIRVPADLSVTGFDDLASSAHHVPALTTIAVPTAEMGRRAGQYLLARIAGRHADEQLPIEARLMLRESTGQPSF